MLTCDEIVISLSAVRFHAFHGVTAQEQQVGADFLVDLTLGWPHTSAIESDELEDTVSYADLFRLVKREMAVPSRLLEHVVGRIAKAVIHDYPDYKWLRLKITKQNPPMGADCQGASVEIVCKNQNHHE